MIIAIDPGTSYCGMSVVSQENDKLTIHKTVLVNGTRKPKGEMKEFQALHTPRYYKLILIMKAFKELMNEFKGKIDNVVVELPFYNSRTPGAFEPIVQVNILIKYLAESLFNVVTYGFEPRTVKVHWAGIGSAKKEHMREAFYSHVDNGSVILTEGIAKEDYAEHVIDSMGISKTWYERKEEVLKCQK